MKGKWTKILLTINMFLCLFGIQMFENENSNVGVAATRTSSKAISLFVWTQKCFGNTSGSVFNKFVITSATYDSSYDGDDLVDWFNNYRGPLATDNTTDTFKNNTSITKSGNNYEITQNGYQANVADGWYHKPGNMSRVFLFPPFVTAINGYVTNSDVGSTASSKLAFSFTSSGANRYAYSIWHDSKDSMGWFDASTATRDEYFDKCTITKKYSGAYGSHAAGSTIGTETRWQYSHHDKPSNPSAITGYTFSNWVKTQGGTTVYNGSTISSDTQIYASYTINQHTVTFVDEGKTSTRTVNYGSALGALPTASGKDGYRFSHWAWESTSGTEVKSTDTITSDKTAYAVYEKIGFTVNYYDGNQLISGYTETISEGGKITHTSAPAKTGYTFKYWCTDSSLNTKYDNNSQVTGNLNLYAKYDINKYTITFKVDETTHSTSTVTHGSALGTLPSNPTKTGYTFRYWAWDSTSGTKVESTNTITSSRTAHAVFNINNYTITFHYGNNNATTSSTSLAYDSIIQSSIFPDAKLSGFKVVGWYYDSTLKNQCNVGLDKIGTSNINLYAKYDEISYRHIYVDGCKVKDIWEFNDDMYIYLYNSSNPSICNASWPGTSGNVVSIGNNIVRISIDESLDVNTLVINNGDKQTQNITLDTKKIYYSLTGGTVAGDYGKNVYTVIEETNPDNLLRAQFADISNTTSDMYRFTMGATSKTNQYGFEFIFITSSNQSIVRYWNFSTDSMLSEVRLGSTLYNKDNVYAGYYSLTINETTMFELSGYERVVVLACCKDSSGINVLKAVEYKINSNGTLTRMA